MNGVVILGAGSSADFGVPTLNRIFTDRQAREYLSERGELHDLLQEVFWEPRGHDLETSKDSLTVEEMLTVLRDWEAEEGEVPDGLGLPDIERFRKELYVLIQRAVFTGKSSSGRYLNRLIDVCSRAFERTTWASFNWDCIFEASFWYASGDPTPPGHVSDRHNPKVVIPLRNWRNGPNRDELLKLHGSIGWWMIDEELTYVRWARGGPLQDRWDAYDQAEDPADFPVILEPSAYKYEDDPYKLLAKQWDVFFDRLCEADCVLIVGYSLPPLDAQARSKILTAFQVNPDCRWAVVDPSYELCGDFERLLGTRRVKTFATGLVGFNNELDENMLEAFPDLDLGASGEGD